MLAESGTVATKPLAILVYVLVCTGTSGTLPTSSSQKIPVRTHSSQFTNSELHLVDVTELGSKYTKKPAMVKIRLNMSVKLT